MEVVCAVSFEVARRPECSVVVLSINGSRCLSAECAGFMPDEYSSGDWNVSVLPWCRWDGLRAVVAYTCTRSLHRQDHPVLPWKRGPQLWWL